MTLNASPSVIELNVIMLNVFMLSVMILNVMILNVIMLNVVVPCSTMWTLSNAITVRVCETFYVRNRLERVPLPNIIFPIYGASLG
jgi:hypothetical protein